MFSCGSSWSRSVSVASADWIVIVCFVSCAFMVCLQCGANKNGQHYHAAPRVVRGFTYSHKMTQG